MQEKKYGAHKVSQYTHPQTYKPQSSDPFGPSQAQTTDLYTALQEKGYKHRYTAADKLNKSNLGEYRSAKDTFQEVSPFSWRKQLEEMENMTPEEYELGRFAIEVSPYITSGLPQVQKTILFWLSLRRPFVQL